MTAALDLHACHIVEKAVACEGPKGHPSSRLLFHMPTDVVVALSKEPKVERRSLGSASDAI